MKTKTFERDGERATVSTCFDEDGEAAIIITHTRRDGSELKSTLTLSDDPAASDAVFNLFNNDNIWDWPNVPGLWG